MPAKTIEIPRYVVFFIFYGWNRIQKYFPGSLLVKIVVKEFDFTRLHIIDWQLFQNVSALYNNNNNNNNNNNKNFI